MIFTLNFHFFQIIRRQADTLTPHASLLTSIFTQKVKPKSEICAIIELRYTEIRRRCMQCRILICSRTACAISNHI